MCVDKYEIDMLDVKDADAFLIHFYDDANKEYIVLVDAGRYEDGERVSKFIKENELPKISLHSLRHTHATLLIACGIPLKTVSARLGHASPTTTSNIYLHAIQSLNAAAAEAINDILSPGKALKNRKVS